MAIQEFSVYSSDGVTTYKVVVEWNGQDLYVICDCKAGRLGDWCHHKNSLLNGDHSVLAAESDLTDVLQWVRASTVHAAMSEILSTEAQQKEAEKLVKKAKEKVLATKRVVANLVNPSRNR